MDQRRSRIASFTDGPKTITLIAALALALLFQGPQCWAQALKEFSDNFPWIEIKGGAKCVEETRQVCLPSNCRIDFDRTYTTQTNFSGGYGIGGPGYGVVVKSVNNHRSAGFATYTLDKNSQCLKSTVKVCAKRQQRGWYEGYQVIYAKCYPKCDCASGSWFDLNRDSCVTGACESVTGMPDGDKGGGYFAWQNTLFKDVPCSSQPCKDLTQTLDTGKGPWTVTSSGGIAPAVVVANPTSAWALPWGGGQWISANANSGSGQWPGGNYTYETTFCLCAGYKNASLQLRVWGDNDITAIRLNGHLIGGPTTNHLAFQDPGLNVSDTTHNHFVPGKNVLQIVVYNLPGSGAGSPTGLRVSGKVIAVGGLCP